MVRLAYVTVLLALIAPVALASDGVLEINQACATSSTGCFPGDTGGFPVTISTAGSYRVTSNLFVPDENTDAITFSDANVSDVSIDLGGFEIRGPVTCSGIPLVCAPASGSGSGVERLSTTNRGISVHDGTITGMGLRGIFLGEQAEVTHVRVRWNRGSGIDVSTASRVSNNSAYQNGSDGIFGGIAAMVFDNTSYGNGGDGIQVSSAGNIRGNTVRGNGGYGLNMGIQATYRENTITNNTTGTVNGGLSMGDNSCEGLATCP